MLLLNEQRVLFEIAELVRLKVAGILGIRPEAVHVSWNLGTARTVLGKAAQVVGVAHLVKGKLHLAVDVDREPVLETFPDDLVAETIEGVVGRAKMDCALRMEGLHERRELD